jgi:hypothetical protein
MMSRLEHISGAVQHQLFESLQEFVDTWHQRAMACRTDPEVFPEQCLDREFLDHKGQPRIDMGKFVLCQPNRMGFVPDPLVFMCSDCHLLVEFKDVMELDRRWIAETKRVDCKKSEEKHHSLRQMDVVFAHWSGNYTGLSPARVVMDTSGSIDSVRTCRNCGSDEYQLRTSSSPFFSEWRFQCVNCLSLTPVVQADRDTLALLMPKMLAKSGHLPKEWNMLPVSYRASSVYYVQRDSFIVFADPELSSLLGSARANDLAIKLMKLYGFPGTALDDDEIVKQLTANGRSSDANQYSVLKGMTPDLGNISAMWRNYGPTLLGDLLTDRSLRCDAGSLCDQRGGACPACIMAPEVACIGGNNLLCRAALNGGPPPGWDADPTPLVGYLRGSQEAR